MSTVSDPKPVGRRRFLASAAASATAATFLKPSLVFGSQANSVVRLGLIGCGGRGRWLIPMFAKTGNYRWTACADYFQDRADAVGQLAQIESAHRYTGLDGYKRMLDDQVDAVVIQTPPYFHPEQAAASVQAGKHVFLSKPVAVDVPGCQSIAQSGAQATENNLVYLVDFQTRADPLFREALRRVRAGDLGRLVMGEAHYPWSGGGRGPRPDTPEAQLRHWYYVLPLSGDFIVEQSIHVLDVATWIADADPISAVGMGGRAVRPEGSIWDHFAVNYQFPDELPVSFTSIQSIPGVQDEIRTRFFGADGVIDTDYFGSVFIRGQKPFEGGPVQNLYTTGAQTNIREFYEFITQGNYANETVAPSVRANLTAVLGRMAAYEGGQVTWADMLQRGEQLEFDLRG